jgi:hypothetical protein
MLLNRGRQREQNLKTYSMAHLGSLRAIVFSVLLVTVSLHIDSDTVELYGRHKCLYRYYVVKIHTSSEHIDCRCYRNKSRKVH